MIGNDYISSISTLGSADRQRNLASRRYFETSLYLLLLVSVLTLVSTGKLDLVSIFVAPAALLLKGYRWWHGWGPELSHRAATWLVVGYFAFFPLDLWWVSRILAADAQNPALYSALLATIHLMLFAMVVRLYSASATRDYLFLALLAFSSMLAAAILTVDTIFLAFFFLFLALGISTFIGLEMRRSGEGTASSPSDSAGAPMRGLHTALGIASGAIAVSALIVGTGIFFLIPRFSAGYLSGFNLQPSLISGFSDDVELGEIGEIKRSSALVMRIKVEGDQAQAQTMHWRGIALTTFDGHRWFSEAHEPIAVSQGSNGWVSLYEPALDARPYIVPVQYSVLLEPMATDAIFVASEPARIRGQFMGEAAQAGRPARNTYLVVDRTGSISNPFHNFSNVRYDAVSNVLRFPAAGLDALRRAPVSYPDSVRELYLQLPRLDPRIPALAKQITARTHNPYDQAHAVEQYLRAHYAYTLDLSGSAPPADPLAYFLFQRRAGHCEYFAAAMTVMMRSLGVPARYVNGFLQGEYNDVAGDYIVRARDAHSWVEVLFPGYGWVTFDPTPPSDEHASGLFAQLGNYWDWFDLQWSEWVINYDFSHQFTLAQNVQHLSHRWVDQFREDFERSRNAGAARVRLWQTRLAEAPRRLGVFAILLALLLLGWSNTSLRTQLIEGLKDRLLLGWRLRVHTGPLPPQTASLFYRRMLRLLEQRGWQKSPAQTPLEFAASLPAGEIGAPVANLTEMYLLARFGNRSLDGQPAARLDQPSSPDSQRCAALLADLRIALRAGHHRASPAPTVAES